MVRVPRPTLFVLMLLLMAGSAAAQTRILCFGDSLTFGFNEDAPRAPVGGPQDGYLPHAARWLGANWGAVTMINRGVPGDSSLDGRLRVASEVASTQPNLVLVLFGTNDVSDAIRVGNVSAGISATREHLSYIVSEIRSRGAQPILATMPPRWGSSMDPDNGVTRQFNSMIRSLAGQLGTTLADIERHFEQVLRRELYSDPFHPSEAGYQLMAEEWAAAVAGTSSSSIDLVAPFPSSVQPTPYTEFASRTSPIRIDFIEIGFGIDTNALTLAVDGQPVEPNVVTTSDGVSISWSSPEPWVLGQRVDVAIAATDLAQMPNTFNATYYFRVSPGNGTGGDIDGSGRIDGIDLAIVGTAFGATASNPRYQFRADIDFNGVVDGVDLSFVASGFGNRP